MGGPVSTDSLIDSLEVLENITKQSAVNGSIKESYQTGKSVNSNNMNKSPIEHGVNGS